MSENITKSVDKFFEDLPRIDLIDLKPLNNTNFPERFEEIRNDINTITDKELRTIMVKYFNMKFYTFGKLKDYEIK